MTTTSLGLLSHKLRRKPNSGNCWVFVLVHFQYAHFVLPNGIIAYAEINCKIHKFSILFTLLSSISILSLT